MRAALGIQVVHRDRRPRVYMAERLMRAQADTGWIGHISQFGPEATSQAAMAAQAVRPTSTMFELRPGCCAIICSRADRGRVMHTGLVCHRKDLTAGLP
jgi:hypothetical protein